jgi:hypothetical protein
MLKNIVFNWCGEIILKILKEKIIKFIRIKTHLGIPIMYTWDTKILRNKKKFISNFFWKQGPILTFQKFITTIWLRFHKLRFHN